MKEKAKQIFNFIGSILILILIIAAFTGKLDSIGEEIGNLELFRGNDTKSAFSGTSSVGVAHDNKEKSPSTKNTQKNTNKENDVSVATFDEFETLISNDSNMGSSITIAATVLESYDTGYLCTITGENPSDVYMIYLMDCNEQYEPGSTIVFTGTYQGYPTDGEFYLIFSPEILYH